MKIIISLIQLEIVYPSSHLMTLSVAKRWQNFRKQPFVLFKGSFGAFSEK